MSSKSKAAVPDAAIPSIIVDATGKKKYLRGRFLGKGGFAKCYELTDMETHDLFAGKIVPKSLLVRPHQKDKMKTEIKIHRSLCHKHIVGFCNFFEDSTFVYIVLEICKRRSLMELHKRRRAITEPETRYYLHQLLDACLYLHTQKVIHRDLKLGNLFLSDEMNVKIGDFGLATKLDYDGERKRTLCGTPNYIAPEVLDKVGHSYEVDIWAIGCIMYTLLVGKPPFETASLKETYNRIKQNEYYIPSRITPPAKKLITRLLHHDPKCRPTITEIMKDDFFTSGYLPSQLPTSVLTMAPRFNNQDLNFTNKPVRKILAEVNGNENISPVSVPKKIEEPSEPLKTVQQTGATTTVTGVGKQTIASDQIENINIQAANDEQDANDNATPSDYYLSDLNQQLIQLLESNPSDRKPVQMDEAEDPAAIPIYWVSKWVDYSDKYGLGYQLCDGSVGVLFNDNTRLLLLTDGDNLQYIERDGDEHFHSLRNFPEHLNKKATLLRYFRNYMSEHLLKAGASVTPRESDQLARLPFLRSWFRTKSAIVLHLSNGTLQINFFQCHTKIILCPLMGAISYIDENKTFTTYRLNQLDKYGATTEISARVRYARTMVERFMACKGGSARMKPVPQGGGRRSAHTPSSTGGGVDPSPATTTGNMESVQ